MNSFAMAFNASINLAALVLCALGVAYVLSGARVDRNLDRFFLNISTCLILFDGATMARQLLNGRPGTTVHGALVCACFVEFCSSCMLAYIASRYLLTVAGLDETALRRIVQCLMLAYIVMLIVSQFTGLYYTVDAQNHYSRSPGYPLCYLVVAVMFLLDGGILIRCRGRLRRKEEIAFWLYLLLPAISIVLQIFIPGISFGVLASTAAAFCLYLIIVGDRTARYYKQVEENAKLKTDILLAQIQPHFLYNSLGAIRSVSYDDPNRAREALDQFTEYLRHNMDALTEGQSIPFMDELKHVERYLELQRLRFGEELNVEYDLACTDFGMPTLTLQPIVENAVTYGVRRQAERPGLVIIRSREYPDRWEVSVIDNGPGFVPDTMPGDGERSHIGLQNVQERLRRVSGGELRIHSVLGEGTTVTIVLPKEAK